jgi:hypothetical protein
MRVSLECFAGVTPVAIRMEAVDHIVEYEVTTQLPLARDFNRPVALRLVEGRRREALVPLADVMAEVL